MNYAVRGAGASCGVLHLLVYNLIADGFIIGSADAGDIDNEYISRVPEDRPTEP